MPSTIRRATMSREFFTQSCLDCVTSYSTRNKPLYKLTSKNNVVESYRTFYLQLIAINSIEAAINSYCALLSQKKRVSNSSIKNLFADYDNIVINSFETFMELVDMGFKTEQEYIDFCNQTKQLRQYFKNLCHRAYYFYKH
jgi:hypothetical protein